MGTDPNSKDWRVIAEQASRERDPHKLLELTQELGDLLEAEQAQKGGTKRESLSTSRCNARSPAR